METPVNQTEEQRLRAELEKDHGKVWNTEEMRQDFDVKGFSMGLAVVRRKSDHKVGTLQFTHAPRFYYAFQEDT